MEFIDTTENLFSKKDGHPKFIKLTSVSQIEITYYNGNKKRQRAFALKFVLLFPINKKKIRINFKKKKRNFLITVEPKSSKTIRACSWIYGCFQGDFLGPLR